MKWGTKIKYTAFIVLCSLAFAVSGISGVFSSFKTEGTSGFSIYYTAPKPVNLQAIQFQNYGTTATSITFDYYNDEYNSIIANATSSSKVDSSGNGAIMLYKVGTDVYVLSSGEIYATSCYQMFYEMRSLTSIKFNNFNTNNVTDMRYMFYNCYRLTSLDLSSFNTSKVTAMYYMFYYCGVTSLDLSSFNTSNVTDMENMFDNCDVTSLDLSSFDTTNVTDMSGMFYYCRRLTSLDLSSFDTTNVTDMSNMFNSSGLITIYVSSSWSTTNVKYSTYMFDGCSKLVGGTGTKYNNSVIDKSSATVTWYLTDINNYSIRVENYASSATSVILDYYNDEYNAIIASATASYPIGRISDDITLYVVGSTVYVLSNREIALHSCASMFRDMTSLTSIKFNNFNTSNVTNMSYMFCLCSGLTSLDLSSFNTSNVTDMYYMFECCWGLTTIYVSSSWSTTNLIYNNSVMFSDCTKLVGGNGTAFNSSYTGAIYARIDTASTPGYLTAISDMVTLIRDTQFRNFASGATSITFDYYNEEYNAVISNAKATLVGASTEDKAMLYVVGTAVYILSNSEIYANESCYQMFYSMTSLTSITFNNFNTSNVTNMSYMFYNCYRLTSLDLSPLDTTNVTDMSYMFGSCSGLTSLDLTPLDTSKVISMSDMFSNCSGLTSLDLSGWDTSKVTNMSSMFDGCSGLTSLDLSPLDTSKVISMSDMFSRCSGLTSLNLSGWDTSKVTDMSFMFYYCSRLTSLDLSPLDTSNVTDMEDMFYSCDKLTTIYVSSSWSTTKVTSSTAMFAYCTKLVGGNGTKYSSSYEDKTYARIDTASTPGYFTAKQ